MKLTLLCSIILISAHTHCHDHKSHRNFDENYETRRGKSYQVLLQTKRPTEKKQNQQSRRTAFIEYIPPVTAPPNGKSLTVKLNHDSLRNLLDMLTVNAITQNTAHQVGASVKPAFTPAVSTRRLGTVKSRRHGGRKSDSTKGPPAYNSYSAEHRNLMDMVNNEFAVTEELPYEKQKVHIINPEESRMPAPASWMTIDLLRRYMIQRADKLRAMPTTTTAQSESTTSNLGEGEKSDNVTNSAENGESENNGAGLPGDGAAPPVDGEAAPADDASPPADDASPPAGDASPPADDAAPPADDAAPPADDAAPPADDAAPPADDANPA